MAQLTQPQNSGFQVDELPPPGTFVGVILDIIDLFGVQRPKYENPSEKETLDVTRFLFGYQGQDGNYYKIQTREMRISGNSKAKLFQFLTGLLGQPPKYGWDYCELRGHPAMVTVMHQQGRRDPTKTYANIASVAPLPAQLQSAVPPVSAFNYVREGDQQSEPTQAPPTPQPPAQAPTAAQVPPPPPPPTPQAQPGHAPQQQQQPYQYPLHVPDPVAKPQAQPAGQSPAADAENTATSAQQPPNTLWNPQTDDAGDVPF